MKPWELRKNPDDAEKLNVVLHLTIESLRISAILLQPLIPNIAALLLNKIGVPVIERHFEHCKIFSWENTSFVSVPLPSEKVVLFRRVGLEKEDKERKMKKA